MYKSKKGWYALINENKFLKPLDLHMQSYSKGKIFYKSKLEYLAFRYADYNPKIKKWSLEPFGIPYKSPIDNKIHRYYVDLFIMFENGNKVLVEIKCLSDLSKPKKPYKATEKSLVIYQEKLKTFYVNLAKWKSAKEFCKKHNMTFIILTDKELL